MAPPPSPPLAAPHVAAPPSPLPTDREDDTQVTLALLSAIASLLPRIGTKTARRRPAHRIRCMQPQTIFCVLLADDTLACRLLPSQWAEIARLTTACARRDVSTRAYGHRMRHLLGQDLLRVLRPYCLGC